MRLSSGHIIPQVLAVHLRCFNLLKVYRCRQCFMAHLTVCRACRCPVSYGRCNTSLSIGQWCSKFHHCGGSSGAKLTACPHILQTVNFTAKAPLTLSLLITWNIVYTTHISVASLDFPFQFIILPLYRADDQSTKAKLIKQAYWRMSYR